MRPGRAGRTAVPQPIPAVLDRRASDGSSVTLDSGATICPSVARLVARKLISLRRALHKDSTLIPKQCAIVEQQHLVPARALSFTGLSLARAAGLSHRQHERIQAKGRVQPSISDSSATIAAVERPVVDLVHQAGGPVLAPHQRQVGMGGVSTGATSGSR